MTPIEHWWNQFMIDFGEYSIATMAIPVVVALLYRKQWHKPLRVVFYYVLATLGVNLLEQGVIWMVNHYQDFWVPIMQKVGIGNTFFLLILYYLKDYLFLGWFLSLIFPKANQRNWVYWLSWSLAGFAVIDYLFFEGFREMGPINSGLDTLFLFVMPLLYLWVSRRESIRIPSKNNPYFWICLGIAIPNVLSLFLYLAGNEIHRLDFVLFAQLTCVRNAIDMIGQGLIAWGFSKARFARFIEQEAN